MQGKEWLPSVNQSKAIETGIINCGHKNIVPVKVNKDTAFFEGFQIQFRLGTGNWKPMFLNPL